MGSYQSEHAGHHKKISFGVTSQEFSKHLQSSQPKARVRKALVYRRAATTVVVHTMAMILTTIKAVPLGFGASKLGVTPGGGVTTGAKEVIPGDHMYSRACAEL